MPEEEAYVSLVTNDSYGTGAIALGRSLRDTGTQRRLSLLITNEVSHPMRARLSNIWDELTVVEEIDSGDTERLALLTRPELGITFSKIHAWRLTQYSKCVFVDADTLVLENVDELFDREELSAAPDIGWPDCFNSGVFVFEPSLETFSNLLDMARQTGSFDGGDQGLLNLFWPDWATKDIKYHLPFIYNVVPNITYGYAPALQRFGRNAKIIHFIGPVKPWQHRYVRDVDAVILSPGSYASQNVAYDYIKRWWQVYNSTMQPTTWPGSATYGWHSSPVPPPPHHPHHPPHPPHSHPPHSHHPHSHPHHSPHPSVHLDTTNHSSDFIAPFRGFPDSFVPSPPSYSPYHITSPFHPISPVTKHTMPIPYPLGPHFAHDSLSAYDSPIFLYDHKPDSISPCGSLLLYSANINLPVGGVTESDVTVHTDSVTPYNAEHIFPSPHSTSIQAESEGSGEHYSYPEGKSSDQTDFEQGRIDYTGRHRFDAIKNFLDSQLD